MLVIDFGKENPNPAARLIWGITNRRPDHLEGRLA